MTDLAEVLRRHGPEYLEKHGESMLPSHRRALGDITRCRTPALGGHVYRCRKCGREHYAYHSCRNRACPTCHRQDTRRWLEKRRGELLPVPYFHVVFTVPHSLREAIRSNQKAAYGLLMRAAATSLIDLARDPKHLGATVGVLAVLHTWGRTLVYHPHVHCLVTGGGVSADRRHWVAGRKGFLVPVRALSRLFRGRFLDLVRRHLPGVVVPKDVWRKDWVVYCRRTIRRPEYLLEYLGRYIHRVALSNGRILSLTDGKVRFRYRPVDAKRWRTMTLGAEEFIRRFLQHVPPKGAHKVRYYGLWAPSNRRLLRSVQLLLGTVEAPDQPCGDVIKGPAGLDFMSRELHDFDRSGSADANEPRRDSSWTHCCPFCGSARLTHLRALHPTSRGPPGLVLPVW